MNSAYSVWDKQTLSLSFSGSGRRDPRQIVEYKDLDAPGDDPEFF